MNAPSFPSLALPRRRFLSTALFAVGLVLVSLPILTSTAQAAAPTASFLNPNNDGPGPNVSDQLDGTDGLFHFVVRASDPDGGTITSVVIQIEDGDADALFEPVGTATRVGTTDTWEFKWDTSAHLPATDVDNDAGTVRAVVTDSGAEISNVDVAVTFRDSTVETVELTGPVNGATATFASGALTVTGTASAGANSVDLFYSTTAATGTDPVYTACGTASTTGATTKTFSGTCSIGTVAPSTVVAIAARVGNGANQSGDAHRVTGAGTAGTTTTTVPGTTPTTLPGGGSQPAGEQGYALVAADGGIFNFGTSRFFGSTGALRLNRPIVGMDHTPSTQGYWLVASDGGIFAFGDARFAGSTGAITLARPIVGMRGTPTGNGYWLVASDGGIFAFGDARFFGSTGAIRLAQPIVGMERTPSGNGYWLVAADGGIFAFGDARFLGSMGATRLNAPIVGMSRTSSGLGYQLVAADGGIFSFGDAVFRGSTGGIRLNSPIAAMTPTATGTGYWLCARDGGVFAFGNAQFRGSMGAVRLNQPVVGCDAPLAQSGVSP